MESKEIINLAEEMIDKKEIHYSGAKEVREFIGSKNLGREDKLILLRLLVDDSIFSWLNYISDEIKDLADDSETFINLVVSILDKIKADMAQSIFTNNLRELGENKPDLSLKIYDKLIKTRNPEVVRLAGILLGGVGLTKYNSIEQYLKRILLDKREEIVMNNLDVLLACLVAVRVITKYSENLSSEQKSFFFDVLNEISAPKNLERVRLEAVALDFDLFKLNQDVCYGTLIGLINENSTENIKRSISERVWIWGLGSREKEFEIISLLSKEENEIITGDISHYLSKNHMLDKEKAADIVYFWLTRESKIYITDMERLIGKMFKQQGTFYRDHFINKISSEGCDRSLHKLHYELRLISRLESDEETTPLFEEIISKLKERLKLISFLDKH